MTSYGPAWVIGNHTFLLLMPVQWPVGKWMVCFLLNVAVIAKHHTGRATSLTFTLNLRKEGRGVNRRWRQNQVVVSRMLFDPPSKCVIHEQG